MYKQLTIIHPKIEGSKEYTFGYKLWVIKITLQDINQILYSVILLFFEPKFYETPTAST